MRFALDIYPERFSPSDSYEKVLRETLDLVIEAEKGFDIAFTAEHHTIELHISPNPLLSLAYWAAHTSKIRLGTAIVTAPYWNPIRLAGESAMVDVMSGGRLELGLGRGAYQYEFDRMAPGMDQLDGGEYLRELVPLIRGLWEGDVEHDGKHWSFPKVTAVPKPIQTPPPMWIAARGEATFDFAIANGCNVMANPFHRPFQEVVDLKRRFDDAVQNHPSPTAPKLLMLRRTCVCETEAELKVAVNALQRYGMRFENLYKNLDAVENGFPRPVAFDEISNKADYTEDALRENLLLGTPETIVEKLRKYQDLGIDYIAYGASFGLPSDLARKSLNLFVEKVIPEFR